MGQRVAGKRLGIIGMGRIGRLGARARGFGIAIHYHNRNRVHQDLETILEATYWKISIRCCGIWISSLSTRPTRPRR